MMETVWECQVCKYLITDLRHTESGPESSCRCYRQTFVDFKKIVREKKVMPVKFCDLCGKEHIVNIKKEIGVTIESCPNIPEMDFEQPLDFPAWNKPPPWEE